MNSSTRPSTCPQCGKPLPDNAPQGLCPACLLAAAMHSPPPQTPLPPEDLSELSRHFPLLIIEELIGTGGMGRVYRAQQPHLNRTVALKVLTPDRASDPEWLERFNREARALARLSHPHIVQVYDFGETPQPYLLMEHVDGVNLRQAMHSGALSAREALAIVPKLCDALHYAHEQGVLHRDIKPENVLIDTQGRVKVVDFGLAKLRDDAQPFTLTQSGARLGTTAYMAPEQIEKPAEVDHRADIYSLGVVFYEMLTGELPLGRFPAPSEASGVDPRLDAVVLRTLEKKRERRFADAGEMKTHVEQMNLSARTPSPNTPPPAPETAPSSREWRWFALIAVLWAFWRIGSLLIGWFTSAYQTQIAFALLASCVASSVLAWRQCLRLRRQQQFHGLLSVLLIAAALEPIFHFITGIFSFLSLYLIEEQAQRQHQNRAIFPLLTMFHRGLYLVFIYLAWDRWRTCGFRSPAGRWSLGRGLGLTLAGLILIWSSPLILLPWAHPLPTLKFSAQGISVDHHASNKAKTRQ